MLQQASCRYHLYVMRWEQFWNMSLTLACHIVTTLWLRRDTQFSKKIKLLTPLNPKSIYPGKKGVAFRNHFLCFSFFLFVSFVCSHSLHVVFTWKKLLEASLFFLDLISFFYVPPTWLSMLLNLLYQNPKGVKATSLMVLNILLHSIYAFDVCLAIINNFSLTLPLKSLVIPPFICFQRILVLATLATLFGLLTKNKAHLKRPCNQCMNIGLVFEPISS